MPPQLVSLFLMSGLDTSARWVPRAESYRGKCQEGHVGDGSPRSTSARSQGRAAPAIALRPPSIDPIPLLAKSVRSGLPHAMHMHEHLSLRHSACLAHTSASSVRAHAGTEQQHLCKMASIIDTISGRLARRAHSFLRMNKHEFLPCNIVPKSTLFASTIDGNG
jgi:hypothetical protein